MRGWRLLAIAALVAVVLAAIVVGCWLADDRELSAFEMELAAAGAGAPSTPATRDDAWWDALLADVPDVEKVSHWYGSYGFAGTRTTWQFHWLRSPLPEVTSRHAMIGDDVADLIAERLARLHGDDVPPRRVALRIRILAWFLVERILIAPRDRLGRLVDAAAKAVGQSPEHAIALVQAVGWRIEDCVAAHVQGAALDAMAEHMPAALLTELRLEVADSLTRSRMAAKKPLHDPLRWFHRYARSGIISESRAWLSLAQADDIAALIAHLRASPPPSGWPESASIPHSYAEGGLLSYLLGRAFAVVGAHALAAMLDGRDPPEDPFDPSGAPIHCHTQADGSHVLYSVGIDAVDDEGDEARDFRFALVPTPP